MTDAVLWSVVLLPALAGGVLLVLGPALSARPASTGGRRWPAAVSLVTAGTVLALSGWAAAARPVVEVAFMAGSTFGLGVDGLTAVMLPLVSTVTLLVLVFSAGDARLGRARFHGFMLLFAAAALLTASATTLPALLLAWEVMGATSYALVGYWWREQRRVSSGLTAFLTTRTADVGLYVAAGAALAGGAGLGLADLADATPGWRVVVAAGIAVAALGKAAQLPFSFWLSRAMDGPSPVSALLHSAAMVAMGGYLLLRAQPLLGVAGWPATAVAWTGALTALLLGAVAVAQSDLKQLLAASTAAQLGFVVLAAGVGTVSGGTAHLVAHAATKALLFLVAGAWLGALGTKQLVSLRGAGRTWPLVGATAAAGLLSLAGVAPLALWATKDAVLAATLEHSTPLYLVALAAAAVSAAYAGKVLVLLWRAPTATTERGYDREEPGSRRVGPWQQAPLVVLALGAVLPGLLALAPVGDWWRRALGDRAAVSATPVELVGSAVLALVVLGLVARASLRGPRLPEPRVLHDWLDLERAAHAVLLRPTEALAAGLARFDDRVLDRGVERLAGATTVLAGRVAAFDTGVVDRGVERIAAGTRRLARAVTRPQSGQLHQYYLQAVVLVAAVSLLLLVK